MTTEGIFRFFSDVKVITVISNGGIKIEDFIGNEDDHLEIQEGGEKSEEGQKEVKEDCVSVLAII